MNVDVEQPTVTVDARIVYDVLTILIEEQVSQRVAIRVIKRFNEYVRNGGSVVSHD